MYVKLLKRSPCENHASGIVKFHFSEFSKVHEHEKSFKTPSMAGEYFSVPKFYTRFAPFSRFRRTVLFVLNTVYFSCSQSGTSAQLKCFLEVFSKSGFISFSDGNIAFMLLHKQPLEKIANLRST